MSRSKETEKHCYFKWGVKGEKGKRPGVQFYKSFTYDGVEYCLHDCVYLYDGKRPNEPHIGKLVKIWRDASKNVNRVKILWFFRPFEIKKHLNSDVLKNEVFLASGEGEGVHNVNDLDVLVGKCNVVCISKDDRNPQPSAEELERAHYIFHRTFDVGKFRISDKIGDSVGGTKITDIFNKKRNLQFVNAPKLPSNLIKSSSFSRPNSVKTAGKEGNYENASCIEGPGLGKGREQTLFKNTTGSKGFKADNNRFQPNSKRDCNNLLASSSNAARKYGSLQDLSIPTKANVPHFESKSNAYWVQKSGGSKGFEADNNRFQPNSKRDCNNLLASSSNAAMKYGSLRDLSKPTKVNVPHFESKSNDYWVQKSVNWSSNVKTDYREKGTTIHVYVCGNGIIVSSEGRSANKNEGTMLNDNKDKFYQIIPDLYAVPAGNVFVIEYVMKKLKCASDDLRSLPIDEVLNFLMKRVKEGCKLADKLKRKNKREKFDESPTLATFFVCGFNLNAPILYEVRSSGTEPRQVLTHRGAGSGFKFGKFIDMEIPRNDEDLFLTWVRKCMVRAALYDKGTGGILRVRKLTGGDALNIDMLYEGHIVDGYYEWYEDYEVIDTKHALFAVCPTTIQLDSIMTYFEYIGKELATAHTLFWTDRLGEKKQFRRLKFAVEEAKHVYEELQLIESTRQKNIDGVDYLEVLFNIPEKSSAAKKQKLTVAANQDWEETIFIMKPSRDTLKYFKSDDSFAMLPPKEKDNNW